MPWIWENGVAHRGDAAEDFVREHFAETQRRVLLLAGAGFDPRATYVSEALAAACENLRAVFIREVRSDANRHLQERAQSQLQQLCSLIPVSEVTVINIFAEDMAVIGGREAVNTVRKLPFEELTDIVVDVSALSLSVVFPVVRYLLEAAIPSLNIHIMVAVNPEIDAVIVPLSGDTVDYIHGFKGTLGLDEMRKTACLWVPQLAFGRQTILDGIHQHLEDRTDGLDVCPLLPFPSQDPCLSDKLIADYLSEFESKWKIGISSVIYASENNPLDVYRTILRMRDERASVFQALGGSQIVLSPAGGKCSAIGMLMAAVDGNFPVVYVEALSHNADYTRISEMAATRSQLTHVWLQGEGVPFSVADRS